MRKSTREPPDPDTPTKAELAQWRREERAARAAERAVEREINRVSPEFIALRFPRPAKRKPWRLEFKRALAKAMAGHRSRSERRSLRSAGVSAGGCGVGAGCGL